MNVIKTAIKILNWTTGTVNGSSRCHGENGDDCSCGCTISSDEVNSSSSGSKCGKCGHPIGNHWD